jgi:hypothetical protein
MSQAATAAADPELDHPGIRSVPCGFTAFQKEEFSPELHIANSSILHFPKLFIPA